ncbi:apolipoprotein A-IV-like [Solea senegalensis]|uniref:Apolipoprotein A-IV n=1 Tax=Solea senegalensis TaxID=28829 RepID=A0A0M3R7Y5_SOLSE|nr:apolipoprotein A-I-like [Solea senegalensis]ALC78627.1 apolipoprotein A-IV [Solea senegalensis]KAG7500506.1 apolipoprotein A-IV-like [Solea senegalensis]
MKVLVVLAFAVFSGCNANILWQDAPKSNLEVVKDAFWDYVAKATFTAEDSLKQIRQSELGQEVNTRIAQSSDMVNQYVVALRSQVAPLSQDFMTQFNREVEDLKARLEKDLVSVGENMQPYAQEVVAKIQKHVEGLKKDVAPYVDAMDPEALKTVLLQKSQELKEQLDKSTDELQAQMTPYTQEMRQKMEQSVEEFQKTMMPMAQSFETQLSQKAQELQQNLAPYGEELKAKLEASAQDVQAQLAALWETFSKMTQ